MGLAKASTGLMEFGTAHLCILFIRSTRRQLWKATQLSPMGFLVTLQHQGHHFLCSQACLRVGGSEYILTHVILKSNVNIRIAQGPQTCPRTAVKCLTNVKSARSQEMRLRIILGKL